MESRKKQDWEKDCFEVEEDRVRAIRSPDKQKKSPRSMDLPRQLQRGGPDRGMAGQVVVLGVDSGHELDKGSYDDIGAKVSPSQIVRAQGQHSSPPKTTLASRPSTERAHDAAGINQLSSPYQTERPAGQSTRSPRNLASPIQTDRAKGYRGRIGVAQADSAAQNGLYGYGFATAAGSKAGPSKGLEKSAVGNSARPNMSTSKSTSGISLNAHPNAQAFNMPLAMSTATLALNSPLQLAQSNQPPLQPALGLLNHPVGQSLSLNDSLSTINQSLTNMNTLLPCQTTPGSAAATPSATDQFMQVNEMRKEMRRKEQEHQKQVALLKQKVQLLEMQEREFKHREDKMRRNHETMLRAFQTGAGIKGDDGERQSVTEMEQIKQMRDEYEQENAQMAKKITDMQETIRSKEYEYNSLVVQTEEKDIEAERKVYELQLDKRNLENQIKRLENELVKAESIEKAPGNSETAASEASILRSRLEQERSSHKEELGKQLRCVKELKEQKACQAQQLEFLRTQLNQKDNQRTADRSQIEQLEDQVKTFERQFEEMEQQIEEFSMQLASKDQIIQGMHHQIQNLLHQQSQSQQISLDLGSSIEDDYPAHSMQHRNDGNSSPKRANLMENQRLADENEYLNEQIRSQEQVIKSQQEQIKKYQGTEDLGQLEIKEKQQKIKELTAEVAGVAEELKEERERSQTAVRQQMSLQQQIQVLKAEFEEQRCQQEQAMQEKQQQIERLQQELQENANNFSMHHDLRAKEHSWGPAGTAAQQSPIRFQNVSTLMASREFQQTLINGMQLQQHAQKSQHSNMQVQQNISVISSGVGSRQQNNMQASHLNVSEDGQSKVFGSVAQSQKQMVDPLGSGDQHSQQFQPQEDHQQTTEVFHTTEEGHLAQGINNATLNLNISNYQASIAAANNDPINGDLPSQQQAYQASAESLDCLPEGYGDSLRARTGAQQARPGRSKHEVSAQEYMSYVAQFDLPRQNHSHSHVQSQTHCDVAEHHFEDTLDEQDRKWVPASELDLLQSCQKIIDAALSMTCSQCLRVFPTTDFYDHIIVRRECIIETEGNLDTSVNEQAAEQPSQLLETEQFQQLYQQPVVSESYEESGIRSRQGQEEELKADASAAQSLVAEREAGTSSKMYEALNMPLQLKPSEIERSYATQMRTNSAAAGAITAHKVEQTVFSGPRVGGIRDDKDQAPNECDDVSSSQVHSVQHTAQNVNRQTQRLLSGQKATIAAQKRLSSLSPFGQMQSSHRSGASKMGAQSTAAQGNKSKRYRHQGGAQGASFGQTAINAFGLANGVSGTAATGACAQGYGSRSGMGLSRGTGMTGTVHSHILMSLSRTESSRSAFSGKEIEDADPAFPKAQPNGQPSNAANFSNDQDNIKYLAANYHDQSGHLLHHLHMQNYTDQNLITESAQTMNDPAAILAITDTNLSQTNLSRLGHAEPAPAPGRNRGSTARMSQGSDADGDRQNDAGIAVPGGRTQTEDELQNNMLSQSLRDIVNNQEMPGARVEAVGGAAGMDTMMQSMNNRDSTSPNMKGHLPHPIQDDIVTSLEKLYDLDTSRFEEEYSNLPSVKKKILLKQLVEDEVNFGDEPQETEDCPYGGQGSDELLGHAGAGQHVVSYQTTDKAPEGSARQSKFVDMSRFNYSLPQIDSEAQKPEHPEHPRDQGSTGQSQSNQVRVVGLNLAPMIAKQAPQEPEGKQAASKPKFDLTKKFNEMNIKKDVGQRAQVQQQKKATASKRRATSQKNASKGSSRKSSQRKQMAKKSLNIEVETTEEQESRRACTSAANPRGRPDGKWQGKLNLDLAKVTAHAHPTQPSNQVNGLSGQQQATSRRQGAPLGSNRYSKRGILLPDSSSYTSSPESYPQQDKSTRQPPQEMVAGACSKQVAYPRPKQPSSVKNTQIQPSQLLNNESLKSPQASRLAAGRGAGKTGTEDGPEDKTVEQPGTRQLHHTVKFLSTLNHDRQPHAQLLHANRLDSSGFDINFGSEVHSPLSKKMHMNATGTAPHETGLLKLKSTNFSQLQVSEEELQQHNLLYTTMQDGTKLTGQHQRHDNDGSGEVLMIRDQMARAHGYEREGEVYEENAGAMPMNARDGMNQGMQSHRHQLGKQRGFVPTLMADQDQKHYDAAQLHQASRREVGQLTESEQHLARRILGAQHSLQSTFDRRQQLSSKPLPPSSSIGAANTAKPIISTLQFQNPQTAKQALLLQRQSPTKNSDYIRRSILLSHRSAGTAGNKTKRGDEVDCPSVYDDKEFDEECAQIGNEEHVPATSNDTRGKLPLNGARSQKPKEKPLTRRDPLKNSLFHNFKVQTQRLQQPTRSGGQGAPGGGQQASKQAFTDKWAGHEELSGRPGTLRGAKSQKELVYVPANAADSRVNQSTSWHTNVRGQTSTQLAVQSPNDFVSYHTSGTGQQKQGKGGLQKNKSLSQLQQHLSQTAQLQRGRGNPKKLAAETSAMQHTNFATANAGASLLLHPTNTSALTSLSQAAHLPCVSPLSVSNLSLQQPHLQHAYLDHVPTSTIALPTASHRNPAKPLLYFNESEPSYSDAKPNPTTRLPRTGLNAQLDESLDSNHLDRRQRQQHHTAAPATMKESPALRTKSNSVFAPHTIARQATQQPTQGQQQMRIQQEWRWPTGKDHDANTQGPAIGSHLVGRSGAQKAQKQATGADGLRRGPEPKWSHR